MKVFIVEDELIIAKVFEKLLKNEGNEVSLFRSGEDVVEHILNNNKPELIIMDVQLKGKLNGFETAKLLRKTTVAPIIFTTGNQKSSAEKQAAEINNSHLLIKPVNFDDILAILSKINL